MAAGRKGPSPLTAKRELYRRLMEQGVSNACGECKQCRRGEENHCPQATLIGLTHDGSHAEYVVAHDDFVVPVPDGVAPEQICGGC